MRMRNLFLSLTSYGPFHSFSGRDTDNMENTTAYFLSSTLQFQSTNVNFNVTPKLPGVPLSTVFEESSGLLLGSMIFLGTCFTLYCLGTCLRSKSYYDNLNVPPPYRLATV